MRFLGRLDARYPLEGVPGVPVVMGVMGVRMVVRAKAIVVDRVEAETPDAWVARGEEEEEQEMTILTVTTPLKTAIALEGVGVVG